MDDLHNNLNVYRISLEYDYVNELDIIRQCKVYFIKFKF